MSLEIVLAPGDDPFLPGDLVTLGDLLFLNDYEDTLEDATINYDLVIIKSICFDEQNTFPNT